MVDSLLHSENEDPVLLFVDVVVHPVLR